MEAARVVVVLLAIVTLTVADDGPTKMYLNEVRSLSELPMDKLLRLKSTFASDYGIRPEDTFFGASGKSSSKLPVALPLKRIEKKPIRRYEDHYDDKGKGSKISKFFQLAVTALSYLAFGGYLLALIISALRRNAPATTSASIIYLSNLQQFQRPKRRAIVLDPTDNEFDTDRLYKGMIMLSRGYALYH